MEREVEGLKGFGPYPRRWLLISSTMYASFQEPVVALEKRDVKRLAATLKLLRQISRATEKLPQGRGTISSQSNDLPKIAS